jgi:hypothetical protein
MHFLWETNFAAAHFTAKCRSNDLTTRVHLTITIMSSNHAPFPRRRCSYAVILFSGFGDHKSSREDTPLSYRLVRSILEILRGLKLMRAHRRALE